MATAGATCIAFSAILVRLADVPPSTAAFYRCSYALLMLRMRLEAGVPDTCDLRVRLEQLGDRQGCGRVGAHADPQGFKSAHHEPAVERCERGSEMNANVAAQRAHLVGWTDDRPAERVPVSRHVLRQRVRHEVDTVL
jgi:hypothetical protein